MSEANVDSDAAILSLFAGIGGFEQAFRKAGFSGCISAYETWPSARAVLTSRFPSTQLLGDVKDLPARLHGAEIVTAGFPCTDLSPAGRLAGISGDASGLIIGVLRAIQLQKPEWVLLENVPNMLRLKGGEAMAIIGGMLRDAGYRWCYRTLDAQHFGVAQRRKRVFLLASRNHDPERVLFRDYATASPAIKAARDRQQKAHGFYWTEGNRGVGWGNGVVPTIKGSTTAGIPSAPAIWLPEKPMELKFRTPSIEALETLQGFRPGWTSAAPARDRWKLVGNAVAVPVVQWIAEGLRTYDRLISVEWPKELDEKRGWGTAGISVGERVRSARISEGPLTGPLRRTFTLQRVLEERGSHALSAKATRGFASRLQRSSLRYQDSFMRDLNAYASL
jgi:DNA (cytosine-5)-methyltransferase 1